MNNTSITRRRLIKCGGAFGAGFAVTAAVPRFATASTISALGFPSLSHATPLPLRDDPQVKRIALTAMDAARTLRPSYADVLMIRQDRRTSFANESPLVSYRRLDFAQSMTIGVRALVNGYWGYAAGPVWSVDEATRLGGEAVRQARIAATGKPRTADLAPIAAPAAGNWDMPVEIDPVTVSWAELSDFARGVSSLLGGVPVDFGLYKWERAFASTDGAYATQMTYRATAGSGPLSSIPGGKVPPLTAAAAGWEYLRHFPYIEYRDESTAWWNQMPASDNPEPVVGRFPVVIAPELTAAMLSSTVGRATELDRMMGYRANTQGTSYLADPLEMVGTHAVGSSVVSIAADRTMEKGCATMRWDDEGVMTGTYPLVSGGVLQDCVTSRESASWLASQYQQRGKDIVSHGAMTARDSDPPETTTPNLTMVPRATQASVDDLIAELPKGEKGYLMMGGGNVLVDHQQLNGFGQCALIEVRNGKRVARVERLGTYLFRAPELWKNVLSCGDASTARCVGIEYGSDNVWVPRTRFAHSVSAVPIRVKEMTFIPGGIRV